MHTYKQINDEGLQEIREWLEWIAAPDKIWLFSARAVLQFAIEAENSVDNVIELPAKDTRNNAPATLILNDDAFDVTEIEE